MNNKEIKFITRTAILLALTIVFQSIGRLFPAGFNSQFIVGPLVNASLLVATAAVGIWGGAIIAVLTPFGAILTAAQIPLPLAPIIAVGNFMLVLGFYIVKKKKAIGIVVGAMLKFGFMFAAISVFVRATAVPEAKATGLLTAFTWPQLATALIGGAIALVVIATLKRSMDMWE